MIGLHNILIIINISFACDLKPVISFIKFNCLLLNYFGERNTFHSKQESEWYKMSRIRVETIFCTIIVEIGSDRLLEVINNIYFASASFLLQNLIYLLLIFFLFKMFKWIDLFPKQVFGYDPGC